MIFDFTKDEQKLNYSFVDPVDFHIVTKSIEGVEEKPVHVFPFPQRYGGTLPDDANASNEKKDDNMMAFGFDVNQQEAQKIAEQKEKQMDEEFHIEEQPYNAYQQQVDEGNNNNDDFDLFAAAGANTNTQPV